MKDNRYRLTFNRSSSAVFLSHLDMQRIFQRTVKRANLPVSYSNGFNPHQQMSFALPLSTGMATWNDYIEIEFDDKQDTEYLMDTLNANLPRGINVHGVILMHEKEKSAASLVTAAEYEIFYPCDDDTVTAITGSISDFNSCKEITVNRETKSGQNTVEIRSGVFSLECRREGDFICIELCAAAGSAHSVKPDLVIGYIFSKAGEQYASYKARYIRKRLLLGGESGA